MVEVSQKHVAELGFEFLAELLLIFLPYGADQMGLPHSFWLGFFSWMFAIAIAVRMFWILPLWADRLSNRKKGITATVLVVVILSAMYKPVSVAYVKRNDSLVSPFCYAFFALDMNSDLSISTVERLVITNPTRLAARNVTIVLMDVTPGHVGEEKRIFAPVVYPYFSGRDFFCNGTQTSVVYDAAKYFGTKFQVTLIPENGWETDEVLTELEKGQSLTLIRTGDSKVLERDVSPEVERDGGCNASATWFKYRVRDPKVEDLP
jgi:hypothetical protein